MFGEGKVLSRFDSRRTRRSLGADGQARKRERTPPQASLRVQKAEWPLLNAASAGEGGQVREHGCEKPESVCRE